MEGGRSELWDRLDRLWQCSRFEVSLDYVRPCLKNEKLKLKAELLNNF